MIDWGTHRFGAAIICDVRSIPTVSSSALAPANHYRDRAKRAPYTL